MLGASAPGHAIIASHRGPFSPRRGSPPSPSGAARASSGPRPVPSSARRAHDHRGFIFWALVSWSGTFALALSVAGRASGPGVCPRTLEDETGVCPRTLEDEAGVVAVARSGVRQQTALASLRSRWRAMLPITVFSLRMAWGWER